MPAVLLTGGGSTNWLPLLFPLVAFLVLLKLGAYALQRIRRRRLHRENELINDLLSPGISPDQEQV